MTGRALEERNATALEHYARAESALANDRDALQQAEREEQAAVFQLKTCANKIAEIDNAIKLIDDNLNAVRTGLSQREEDLAGLDETPLNAELGASDRRTHPQGTGAGGRPRYSRAHGNGTAPD
jgi:chromosome segregation ATPase